MSITATTGLEEVPSVSPTQGLDASDGRAAVPERDAAQIAQRLRRLNEIGLALSAERDIERLLEIILSTSRELTDADAGSLYLVKRGTKPESTEDDTLHFCRAQNDSIHIETVNVTFAVSSHSLAGYAALTGETLRFDDAYEIDPTAPYKFNPSFDKEHGYRTKSVLVLPLKNHANQVIGVLQLLNRKRRTHTLLSSPEVAEREVVPFDQELTDLAASLASQAAVALENNELLQEVTKLLADIENLFDSFVLASSSAIEDRDPSTSGHSARVTILTVGMAQAASDATDGAFKDIHFTELQIKELRYAALLHDFGKIGVRENILTKSHKLEPLHFDLVRHRFMVLRAARETEYARRQARLALEKPPGELDEALAELNVRMQRELTELDEKMAVLVRANDPSETFLPDDQYARQQEVLLELSALLYTNERGETLPLLTQDEMRALSVRKGSLTPEEYEQIKLHAKLSYDFLKQIPWTTEFCSIPNIAHCHHEKLNGKGYPRGVHGPEIPLQARMMTVADIYDALTAADRPYKRALGLDKALQILQWEAREGGIDPDVLELFISREIYKLTEGWHISFLQQGENAGVKS